MFRSVVVTRRSPHRLDHELLLREQHQQQQARISEADRTRLSLVGQVDQAGQALAGQQRRALLAVVCALGLGFSGGGWWVGGSPALGSSSWNPLLSHPESKTGEGRKPHGEIGGGCHAGEAGHLGHPVGSGVSIAAVAAAHQIKRLPWPEHRPPTNGAAIA